MKHLVRSMAVMVCLAGTSFAQNGGNINVNTFSPPMDSRGIITVESAESLQHLEYSFGLWLTWAHNLVRFENSGTGNTFEVTDIANPTFVGALGLDLGIPVSIGVSAPINLVYGNRDPNFVDLMDPNNNNDFRFSAQGFGDLGLHLKAQFMSPKWGNPIGIALKGSLHLATRTEDDSFMGADGMMPDVRLIVERQFGRKVRIALNGGFRARLGDFHGYTDNSIGGTPPPPTTGETIEAKNSIPWGVGIGYALTPRKTEVMLEAFGQVPLDGQNYKPLEALLGLKLYLADRSFFTLGGGVGIPWTEAPNPDVRIFAGIVLEPSVGDRDGDGYADNVDGCPDDPEDFDDFEDKDGCPDPDNDKDGILDVDDECPNNPEDKDGIEDEDGCPEGEINDRDGDGIPDNVDKCPDDPEDFDDFEDEDGCPDLDNDKDGIPDTEDVCPDNPEDFDKFEDEDGCPDPDNDRDRIVDVEDKCPLEPETYNGKDDEDGCPDKGSVVVTDTNIMILDKVHFATASDKILPKSFPILDAVTATLNGHPDITLIEVQGHTDERGKDAYNMDLSKRRAASVKRYLLNKGIAASRLQSQGYGETQPIDPRSNAKAWAKNRRVEFVILKRGGTQ